MGYRTMQYLKQNKEVLEYLGFCKEKGYVYSEKVNDTDYRIFTVDAKSKDMDHLISYSIKRGTHQ